MSSAEPSAESVDQATAEWDGGTQVMPTTAETDVVELAWSADTDSLDMQPGARRPLPRPLIILLAAVTGGALLVAAFIAGQHQAHRAAAPVPATPPSTKPLPAPPAADTRPPPAASSPTLSSLPAAPPTITTTTVTETPAAAAPTVPGVLTSPNSALGRQICSYFKGNAHSTMDEAIVGTQQQTGWTMQQSAEFVAETVATQCPQYSRSDH